ncbi:hypothetical protein LINPERHAP2_LOCUS16285, partial [Linum perenne]
MTERPLNFPENSEQSSNFLKVTSQPLFFSDQASTAGERLRPPPPSSQAVVETATASQLLGGRRRR